jgi:DoxX.
MTHSTAERKFILVFRLLMAWTFLYAASHQVFNPKFSAAGFLRQTKTFHDVYAVLATQAMDPILTFLVSYGHLLIGLSLLLGLMVRVSGAFGVALLMMYWTATWIGHISRTQTTSLSTTTSFTRQCASI